jgi:hypothetical protein
VILLGLPIVLLLGALALRALGGVHAPSRGERLYVALSPLPLVTSLLVPALVGFGGGFSGASQRAWVRGATFAGLGLSLVLAATGLYLVLRLVNRRAPWGWPLGASVVVAASPALLVSLSSGLLWLLSRLL